MFNKYRHIHFIGIGGIGMSGIAEVLLNLGYQVSGSDLKRSPALVRLKKKGAVIYNGHAKANMNGAQVVVTSSAVKEHNPEVKKARDQNIPVVPRAEMLAELMRMKYGIAVAGTHGKTTTTSMIGQVFYEAGLDPTLIIGGRVNSLRGNSRLGKGEYLIAEADESDRSFLKLNPAIAVITNIDPEHMENYKNFSDVKRCYAGFANKVPFYGAVVAGSDHPNVRRIFPQLSRHLITYGIKQSADYTARNIEQKENCMSFEVLHLGEPLGKIVLNQPGIHQVSNALGTIAAARECDIPFPKIKRALRNFKGIGRRFEILRKGNPMVVDDYAHHPAEIEATLNAARKGWPDFKAVVVMQPHRYTRLKALWDDFIKVLGKADSVMVMPVYPAGEKPIGNITGEKFFMKLRQTHSKIPVAFVENLNEIEAALKPWIGPKTMVLFLGAGDVTKTAREFVKKL